MQMSYFTSKTLKLRHTTISTSKVGGGGGGIYFPVLHHLTLLNNGRLLCTFLFVNKPFNHTSVHMNLDLSTVHSYNTVCRKLSAYSHKKVQKVRIPDHISGTLERILFHYLL